MSESDPRHELRDLVAGLRTHLAWRRRGGTWAAAGADSPRRMPRPAPAAAPDPADTPSRVLPVVESAPRASAAAAPAGRDSLATIREDLGNCTRCKLSAGRTNIVFGVGAADAPLMFVGEGPGADEDRRGEPFVGKAGQLLDKMIMAMGWHRDAVYIANVVKCRPPGNRDPESDEVEACQPFLMRQIKSVAPRVIVTLGRPAAHLLLKTRAPISSLRGRWQQVGEVRVMPTFHPAYLLRSPDKKRDAWDDLKLVIAALNELGVASSRPPRG